MASHRRSAAPAWPRAAAAHRSRLSAGFRADLRRLVALAEEVGAYSVKLGSVTVTLRLRQDVLHGAGHGSGDAAARVAAQAKAGPRSRWRTAAHSLTRRCRRGQTAIFLKVNLGSTASSGAAGRGRPRGTRHGRAWRTCRRSRCPRRRAWARRRRWARVRRGLAPAWDWRRARARATRSDGSSTIVPRTLSISIGIVGVHTQLCSCVAYPMAAHAPSHVCMCKVATHSVATRY